jgi:hypothetical protein
MARPAGQAGHQLFQLRPFLPGRNAECRQPFGDGFQRIARHAEQQVPSALAGQGAEVGIVADGGQHRAVKPQLAVGHRAGGLPLIEEGRAPLRDEGRIGWEGRRSGTGFLHGQVQQPGHQQVEPRDVRPDQLEGRVQAAQLPDRRIAQAPLVKLSGRKQLAPLAKRQAPARAEPLRRQPNRRLERQALEPGERIDGDGAFQRPERGGGASGQCDQSRHLGPGENRVGGGQLDHHVHFASPVPVAGRAPALMRRT